MKSKCWYLSVLLGAVLCLILSPGALWANNLRITGVTLEDRDQTANTVVVQFDIAWDNSWRNSTNHDAVWVVVKNSSANPFTHADLYTSGLTPVSFSTGTNGDLEIYVPSDKTGAFIRRKASGTGNVSSQHVRMVVDYNSFSAADTDTIKLKVFGVEMVYIPTGPFYAGDISSDGAFAGLSIGANFTAAWYISSSGAIVTNTSPAGGYYYRKPTTTTGSQASTGEVFTIPAAYPKGYAAFYCMKYEVTEGQYVDFLNGLGTTAQTSRDITASASAGKNLDGVKFRNTVTGAPAGTTSSFNSTRPDRAMNYLSYMDLAAYLDWMALRPMSELEYEKAVSGPASYAIASNNYAWGTGTPTVALTFSVSSEQGAMETVTDSNANSVFGTRTWTAGDAAASTGHYQGPARVGIFATSSTSTQAATAGGYYGVMEMSGNLWERVISVGETNNQCLGFYGVHGDGAVTSVGDADAANWPTTATFVSTGAGTGFRGGAWDTTTDALRVPDRSWAVRGTFNSRARDSGGRGVRTYDGTDL